MRPWIPDIPASDGEAPSTAPTTRFNVAILERAYAYEFLAFCTLNAQACSVMAVSDVGDPVLRDMGGCDLRTAADSYDIFENGKLVRKVSDLRDVWRDDFVGIAIGCSLALDTLLLEQGIVPKHIRNKRRVPVLRTGLQARSVGRFSSSLMVTMRVFKEREIARVCQASASYPAIHGGPLHVGKAEALGASPEPVLGDRVTPDEGELAAFWGCGVTAATALAGAALPMAITNSDMHLCASRMPLHSVSIS